LRQELNNVLNSHVKKSPHINDDFHGELLIRFEAGKVVGMDLREKFKPKPQHEVNVRNALKKFG